MAQDWQDITKAIKDLLSDPDNALNLQVVYDYEKSTIEGFPALIIAKSDNDAQYASTARDKCVFAFKLRCYYPIKDEADHEQAERALEKVVDEILSIFRTKKILGAACDWVAPAPSIWEYEERGAGVYRVAEVTLNCIKYVAQS